MIRFEKFVLDNGIRLLIHENEDTALATLNVLYDVGSKDEDPNKTGLAHLMEHLMFEGSANVKNYDEVLQNAGGESNAFTNNDVTNYYLYLPAQNLELGFWLESDRLMNLTLSEKKFLNQQKVVLEEFEETTLDVPYGDAWHYLRSLAYKKHSYRWPVIGLKKEHVANFTYQDITHFYQKHYQPQHSIWVVSGPVKTAAVLKLANKWLADIPNKKKYIRNLEKEPEQLEFREKNIEGNFPANAIYMAFKMPKRNNSKYYACEIISDVLSTGRSCRLIQNLVKENEIFSSIDAYVTGDIDEGLFVIEGHLNDGVSFDVAENAVWSELNELKTNVVGKNELLRIKNKIESSLEFADTSLLNVSINLAFYELMGNANEVNEEVEKFRSVSENEILETANYLFQKSRCSIVRYKN